MLSSFTNHVRNHVSDHSLPLCIIFYFSFLQTTQFDPDEFYQTLEPSLHLLSRPSHLTWEWSSSFNLRSTLNLLPYSLSYALGLNLIGVKLLNALQAYAIYLLTLSLSISHLSTKDKNTDKNKTEYRCRQLLISTNWFFLYSCNRSTSNNVETILTTLVVLMTLRKSSPILTCLIMSLSISIRFTSVLIFLPLHLLHFPPLSKLPLYILSSLTFLLLFHSFDCIIKSIPITTLPSFLNNITFNVLLNKSNLYGTQPFHWYFTEGILTVFAFYIPYINLKGRFNLIIVVYVGILSVTAHKELRFMTPILPLVFSDMGVPGLRFFRGAVFFNLGAAIFFNFAWQSGGVLGVKSLRVGEGGRVYLMTECHQTPSYSHLGGREFLEVKGLDCGPECRERGDCESWKFMDDKVETLRGETFEEGWVVYQFENEEEEIEGGTVLEGKGGTFRNKFWRNRYESISGGEGFAVYQMN
ncbi:hypothetical protein TrVE_jg10754 [Triparma verrucosa]|uniref:Mannosyltransferase n=1 Tax=Triparma verrucosa TaxID=1606542 RepID=A0A9W7EVG9_9STRA|nr:hypothetical protein TrVE_jg10754 [Triparma verrucosa]